MNNHADKKLNWKTCCVNAAFVKVQNLSNQNLSNKNLKLFSRRESSRKPNKPSWLQTERSAALQFLCSTKSSSSSAWTQEQTASITTTQTRSWPGFVGIHRPVPTWKVLWVMWLMWMTLSGESARICRNLTGPKTAIRFLKPGQNTASQLSSAVCPAGRHLQHLHQPPAAAARDKQRLTSSYCFILAPNGLKAINKTKLLNTFIQRNPWKGSLTWVRGFPLKKQRVQLNHTEVNMQHSKRQRHPVSAARMNRRVSDRNLKMMKSCLETQKL